MGFWFVARRVFYSTLSSGSLYRYSNQALPIRTCYFLFLITLSKMKLFHAGSLPQVGSVGKFEKKKVSAMTAGKKVGH